QVERAAREAAVLREAAEAALDWYAARHVSRAVCDACEGEVQVEHVACRGTGRVTCADCKGTGARRCGRCKGTGQVEVVSFGVGGGMSVHDCPACRGGQLTCPDCRGTRQVTCPGCTRGAVRCPDCLDGLPRALGR